VFVRIFGSIDRREKECEGEDNPAFMRTHMCRKGEGEGLGDDDDGRRIAKGFSFLSMRDGKKKLEEFFEGF
jgi:hypothetical protein